MLTPIPSYSTQEMLTTLFLLLPGLMMIVLVRKGDAASKVTYYYIAIGVELLLKCCIFAHWWMCSHFQTARLRARRRARAARRLARWLERRLAKHTARSKRGASHTNFVLPGRAPALLPWACASTLMLATALDMDLLRIAAVDFCVFAHLFVRLSSMSQVHFILNRIIDVGQQALCRRGRSVHRPARSHRRVKSQGNAHQGGLGAEIANRAWKVGYIVMSLFPPVFSVCCYSARQILCTLFQLVMGKVWCRHAFGFLTLSDSPLPHLVDVYLSSALVGSVRGSIYSPGWLFAFL